MRKLLGWAALVGGSLSGMALALLALGPALGFYPWSAATPGPRTAGSVDLPRALVAASQRPAPQALDAPTALGTITFAPAATTITPALGPDVSREGRQIRTDRGGNPVPTGSLTPVDDGAGTPAAPVTPTAPVTPAAPAPVAPAPSAEQPAAPVAAAEAPKEDKKDPPSFSAASTVAEEEQVQDQPRGKAVGWWKKRLTGRGRSEETPAPAAVPQTDPAPVAEEYEGRQGWDDHYDNDDHNHGRGHDHDKHDDHPGRGWKD